ncbi:YopX protein [Breznakibacter xylanolyticus]|uniref:YopX protein n=1 Tax=Breznakibacter xylanolyticus TaxID=990 RepID=A0A2W7ND60_9BACT|nr:YopX family protein [Breznakibacter xylanolyticus]PZX18088.1 YopX protein [Breznakibacter xylanolyticus]
MKRVIKFRAISYRTCDFVFGSLVEDKEEFFILSDGEKFHVVKESIDQFTGMIDGYGVEIYESDVLRRIGKGTNEYFVYFDNGLFLLQNQFGRWGTLEKYFEICISFDLKAEVIGNFYETPELCEHALPNQS